MFATHETLIAQTQAIGGGKKSMKCDLMGIIRVRVREEGVYAGTSISDAVNAFNEW